MKVSKFMTQKLVLAQPEDGARRTFFAMLEHNIRHMPVVDTNKRLLGIISDRDLRRPNWVDEGEDLSHVYHLDDEMKVGDLMTTNVMTVQTYDSLHKAAGLFVEHRFGCLPVLDKDDALVGVLSPIDLIAAYDEFETQTRKKAAH